MQHSDGDDRLLAALRGHRASAETPAEATELRAAQRIGAIARAAEANAPDDVSGLLGDSSPAPSFEAIAAALGDELTADDRFSARPAVTTLPTEPADDSPVPESPATTTADVLDLTRRRRPPVRAWFPSVAAAAIAVIAGSFFLLRDGGGELIDDVALDPVVAGSATAELRESDDGFELRVDVDGLSAEDGYLELWLIDAEVTQLISLGPLRPDGVYELPSGLDPADFPVVDISVEPFDGDPTHSGDTVFRGQLDFQ